MTFIVSSALWADHRTDIVNLADYGRPALGRNAPELFIDKPAGKSRQARLPGLPPVGVCVEAGVTDHDLVLIRDVRRHPGDQLIGGHNTYLPNY
jgi:hypothetical protein